MVANVYCNTADFPSLVSAAAERGADVFVEVGAGDLRAAAARDVLGKRGAPHVAVAFDRRGADPWRQLLKMAATLISNGATGCQISGLYHPALLAATDAQVNGPPIKKSVKAARKRIEINGRFRGMAADPLRRVSNSPGSPDNRLLATSSASPPASLADLTTPGGTPEARARRCGSWTSDDGDDQLCKERTCTPTTSSSLLGWGGLREGR